MKNGSSRRLKKIKKDFMAPSIVDKLPFFDNVATGLMARLMHLSEKLDLKNPKGTQSVLHQIDGKLLKLFGKYFPNDPPGMEELTGLQFIQQESSTICKHLNDFYTTLIDVVEFQGMVQEVLTTVLNDLHQFQVGPRCIVFRKKLRTDIMTDITSSWINPSVFFR